MVFMMTEKVAANEQNGEWRWRIINARNREFDNVFFFGVSSTGIYCKPSCPARRPKRENTLFFDSSTEAENDGFRACLRCRPKLKNMRDENAEMIVTACKIIESNFDSEISLEFLAAELDVSSSHLQRTFKDLLGISPKEFARARRIENFKREVRQTDITTAIYESGFGSSRRLYEKAGQNLGMTPAVYRKGGKGEGIRFATADTSLGKLLVAATEKGVCSVAFGETDAELESNLKDEFPAAEIQSDEQKLQSYVRLIVEHLDGKRKTLDLPLDLQATAFQMQVWAELRRIPYGETRSYKQIAENIGNKKAVRAVARACATNPIALINPCHRVIAANGNLSGYRWGINRKKILLEKEQLTQNGGSV